MAGLFSPVKATRGKMMTVGGGLIMTVGVTLCFLPLFGETTRTKVLCGRDENAGLEGVPGSLISLPKVGYQQCTKKKGIYMTRL